MDRLDVEVSDLLMHFAQRASGIPGVNTFGFRMCFEGNLDYQTLQQAIEFLLDAQPVLGCRFVTGRGWPFWERVPAATRKSLISVDTQEALKAFQMSGLESEAGIQLKGALLSHADGDTLYMKMTHQAGDAGGFREAVHQLAEIYTALKQNGDYRPPSPGRIDRSLGKVARNLPLRLYPAIALSMLRQIGRGSVRAFSVPFADGVIEPFSVIEWKFGAARTAVLGTYARRHGATLNDLLVTGFIRAAARQDAWDGKLPIRVSISVDLRRYLPQRRAEGIANHTGGDIVLFRGSRHSTLEETLRAVQTDTRANRPVSGLGALPVNFIARVMASVLLCVFSFDGLIRSAESNARKAKQKKKRHDALHLIANAGIFEGGRLMFGDLQPTSAVMLPPPGGPPMIGILASSFLPGRRGLRGEGDLTISIAVPDSIENEVRLFMECVISELDSALPAVPAASGESGQPNRTTSNINKTYPDSK